MAIVRDCVLSKEVSAGTCRFEKTLLAQIVSKLVIFPHLSNLAQHPHLTTLEPNVFGIIVNRTLAVEAVKKAAIS